MPCEEIMELESIWQKRFERANSAESGGLFPIPAGTTVRQLRAKQAQAAHAILLHQTQCPACNGGEPVEPSTWSSSRAS